MFAQLRKYDNTVWKVRRNPEQRPLGGRRMVVLTIQILDGSNLYHCGGDKR
jgi:hypothetical protein